MKPYEVSFRRVIFAFHVLVCLQLITSILLFDSVYGWQWSSWKHAFFSIEGGRSWESLIKTVVPHLVAIMVTVLVVSHFLAFIDGITPKKRAFLGISLSAFALLDICSPLIIHISGEWLLWLKPLGFFGFQVTFLVHLVIIFKSFLPSCQVQSSTKSTS